MQKQKKEVPNPRIDVGSTILWNVHTLPSLYVHATAFHSGFRTKKKKQNKSYDLKKLIFND